jgi:hypothetical protein
MNTQKLRMISLVLATGLSGAAQAALQARDLDGNLATFEAYYDTDLNITWLADANYALTSGYDADGLMNWADAKTWAASLSFADGVNVYDNWRLPTVGPVNGISFDYSGATNGSSDVGYNITSPQSEMAYMFYVNLSNPGYYTPAGALGVCDVLTHSQTCLANVGPFGNLQSGGYWSATAYASYTDFVWQFNMIDGSQGGTFTDSAINAWAVSPGDVAAVPEPETYAMLLAGLGLVGFAARRRVAIK